MEGLPQSATGQATLLTGVNAARLMGRHYGPWPGPTLTPVLEEGTLFHAAQARGGAVLANAYPPGFFQALARRKIKPSSNVAAALAAGVNLRNLEQYARGEAVAADLTGDYFVTLREGVTTQPPEGAAAALAALTRGAALTFFDLWLTDTLGHARDHAGGKALLERFDALLKALLAAGAGEAFTLIITSDHGNLEDLRSGSHTLNPVPLLVIGEGAALFSGATSLLDVAPAVNRLWEFP